MGSSWKTEFDDEEVEVRGSADGFILRQAEQGTAVDEVCRKADMSEVTFSPWRKKYAGLIPAEMKRQLEEENSELKKLVADLSSDNAMLQDVLSRKL